MMANQAEIRNEGELRMWLEQLHPSSCGWALSCCSGDADMANDAVQSAYLKILQGRARYGGRASFKSWLFSVIRITVMDEKRRRWWRRLRLVKWESEAQVQAPVRGEHLDESARLGAFREALALLPARQREVLHLVFYQDLSVQEASKIMGVSLGTARTHYERGKRALRSHLEKTEHFYDYGQQRERFEIAVWRT